MAATLGRDDALNPTAGSVFVLLWVGVPLLSLLLGPVWRLVNPIRGLHGLLLARCCGRRPSEGLSPLPARLGYWPAALSLLAFVWLELVAPENTSLARAAHLLRRLPRGAPARRDLLRVAVVRPRPTASRCSPAWSGGCRCSAGAATAGWWCATRCPGWPGRRWRRGCSRSSGVLLGSTAYDSFASSPWWVGRVQDELGEPAAAGDARPGRRRGARDAARSSCAAALSGRGAGLPAAARGRRVRAHAGPDRRRVRRRALLVAAGADRAADRHPALRPARHRRELAGHRRPRPSTRRWPTRRSCRCCRCAPSSSGTCSA